MLVPVILKVLVNVPKQSLLLELHLYYTIRIQTIYKNSKNRLVPDTRSISTYKKGIDQQKQM